MSQLRLQLCHQNKEPILITKNGYGDLVVMSMEAYESSIAPEFIELEYSLK